MAQSIVQGGSGYPFFAACVYSYLCGECISAINVLTSEGPSELRNVHELIEKV